MFTQAFGLKIWGVVTMPMKFPNELGGVNRCFARAVDSLCRSPKPTPDLFELSACLPRPKYSPIAKFHEQSMPANVESSPVQASPDLPTFQTSYHGSPKANSVASKETGSPRGLARDESNGLISSLMNAAHNAANLMKTKHGVSVETLELPSSNDSIQKQQRLLAPAVSLTQNLDVASHDFSFAGHSEIFDTASLSASNVHFEPKHKSPIHSLGEGDLSLGHFEKRDLAQKDQADSSDASVNGDPSSAASNNRLLVSGTQDSKVVRRKSISTGSIVESVSTDSTIDTNGTDCHTYNPSDLSNLDIDQFLESPNKLQVQPKKDKEFHSIFKRIPASEHLLADFSCALSKDILVHGKLYLSPHYICFNSNILGWVTNIVVPIQEIIQIEKKSTAVLFPNGMVIRTLHQKHVFATFLSRDTTFNMITQVWHKALQDSSPDCFTKPKRTLTKRKSLARRSTTEDLDSPNDSASNESLRGSEDDGELLQSEDANDLTFVSKASEKSKVKDSKKPKQPKESSVLGSESDVDTDSMDPTKSPQPSLDGKGENLFKGFVNPGPKRHSQTSFEHEKVDGEVEILQHTFNAPLGVVYNLLYGPDNSTFLRILEEGKNFDIGKEKITELDSLHKEREYSYIRPLSGPIGPKQTKCLITETLHHFDYSTYCELEQVTKNPDVPLGNSFKVRTRFYFSWGPKNTTKLSVYTIVEWSAKSWIKLAVEKGSIDGQKTSMKLLVDIMTDILNSGGSGTAKKKRKRSKGDSQSTVKAPEPPQKAPEPKTILELIGEILDRIGMSIPVQVPMMSNTATGGIVFLLMSLLYSYVLTFFMGGRLTKIPSSKSLLLGEGRYVVMPSLESFVNDEQLRRQNEAQLWNWIASRIGDDDSSTEKRGTIDEVYADETFKEMMRMTKNRIDAFCMGLL